MTAPATGTYVVPGFADAGFVPPRYSGASLGSVLPGIADALGVPVRPAEESADARDALGLPRVDRVCLVLVDGLGLDVLTERAGHAPFLRSLLPAGRPLVTGYPSTTAASLGLLGTGVGPGRTGMVGYSARHPGTGALVNLVSWADVGPARAWQREPTVFEAVHAAGVPVTSVGPERFAASGLTEAVLRGGGYRRAESLTDRVDVAVEELMGPALVYLYWGDVDKIGHHHGVGSWQWGEALGELDRELARLARMLPPRTVLAVTADHGMVDVDRSARWDVATTPELRQDVELVAGEPRALHVHLRSRAPETVEAAAARWRATLGPAAVVATREQAVAAGWFGDVVDHVRPALGDLVVACTGRATVVDSRTQSAASLDLVGVHGSFTRREMVVPFLTVHSR